MSSAVKRYLLRVYYKRYLIYCALLLLTAVSIVRTILGALLTHSQSPTRIIDGGGAGGQNGIQETKGTQVCESYGCPMFPLEIDDPRIVKALSRTGSAAKSPNLAAATFAAATRRSNQRLYNQDKTSIVLPFVTNQTPKNQTSFLVGIFDGHGTEGHYVASFASSFVPERLARKLNSKPCCQSDEWIQKQLNATFWETDEEAPPNALRGGCTATVTLRIGSKLFLANAGDSKTVVANYFPTSGLQLEGTTEMLYQTRRDKAHLPDERARIERMGGRIHIPPQNPALSRVIVFSTAAIPHEPIGLAMSRSIGDWEWGLIGVIPEPIIDMVDLSQYRNGNNGSLFLLAASDGMWDAGKRHEWYIQQMGESLYGKKAASTPLSAVVDMIYRVSPIGENQYRDDITVAVVKLN